MPLKMELSININPNAQMHMNLSYMNCIKQTAEEKIENRENASQRSYFNEQIEKRRINTALARNVHHHFWLASALVSH